MALVLASSRLQEKLVLEPLVRRRRRHHRQQLLAPNHVLDEVGSCCRCDRELAASASMIDLVGRLLEVLRGLRSFPWSRVLVWMCREGKKGKGVGHGFVCRSGKHPYRVT